MLTLPDRKRMAHFAETVSGLSVRDLGHKTLFGLIVIGPSKRVQPVHYQVMETPPHEVRSWVHATGNPKTPPLPWPALYTKVARLRVNGAAFEPLYEDEEHADAMPGVAFQFDKGTVLAAVISTLSARDFFAQNPVLHARVGHDDVNLTAGLVNPWERTLTVPVGAVQPGVETNTRRAGQFTPFY